VTIAVTRQAVFLDRDGVINRAVVRDGKSYPPALIEDLEILPGVREAIADLHQAGFLIVVVTNQPDVATGIQPLEIVEAMHKKLREVLLIDDIKVCYHIEADGCACRKPKPGMLLEAACEHNIDLTRSYLVGDRWRDISAGKVAGCFTFFIDYGYKERSADEPDMVVRSLAEARQVILTQVPNALKEFSPTIPL
jgi:D-glycero-D-manno-heptose 1,7-bisphosphate phosphatase